MKRTNRSIRLQFHPSRSNLHLTEGLPEGDRNDIADFRVPRQDTIPLKTTRGRYKIYTIVLENLKKGIGNLLWVSEALSILGQQNRRYWHTKYGTVFQCSAVGSVHGRETEQKYRAKWNDIGYENDQRQRIKANISGGVTATTADIGMYGGRGDKSGCLSDDHDGLAPIDEHGSLRVSSPLKQQRKHPASPMRNAVVHMRSSGLSKPSDSSKMSYAAVVTKDSKHTLAEGGQSGTRAKDQVPRNWTCGDLLGQGAFGSVYLGLDNDTGRLMAVKQVSLGHAGGASSAKIAEHIRSLESEVDTLKLLDHPNIVRYIGTERNAKLINIFLEFVPGGSIASLLTNFGPFKEPVVKMYTKQILLGLEYLHNNGIMHRDIKGANILVENTGLVKLADFGASKKIEDLVTIGSGANSVKGTPYWMAPEVITQTGHGRKADIWSVACTVIEMATGKPPWSQYGSQVSAMFHIAKSKGPPLIPQDLSPECKDFLYLCFNRNWRERPSATTLLDHPFLANVNCPRVHVSEQPRCSEQRVSKTSQENYGTSEGATRDLNPHKATEVQKLHPTLQFQRAAQDARIISRMADLTESKKYQELDENYIGLRTLKWNCQDGQCSNPIIPLS
eukprot:jgi/Picre1/32392/NNA_007738.t1